MRFQFVSVIALVALVSSVHCGCDRSGEQKPSGDGEVTQFLKDLGCDIKKGADKVSESAKPYIEDIKKGAGKVSDSAKPYLEEIGNSAKKFGGTVADRFNNLKERISGSSDNSSLTSENATSAEGKALEESPSSTPSSLPTTSFLPEIEDRIILSAGDEKRCPENQKDDGRGHCRTIG